MMSSSSGRRRDLIRRRPGERQDRLDRLAIRVGPVRREREPQGEPACAAGEVVGQIGGVQGGLRLGGFEVRGVLPVCCDGERRIAIDEGAGVVGREQPLVRVDDERVGALDAIEERPDARCEQRGAPVGGVDVEPETPVGTRVGHPRQVVDDPGVRRAGARHHREHALSVGIERPAEPVAGQPAALVVRDLQDVDVHHPRGGDHAGMHRVTRGESPPGRPAPPALGRRVPRRHERREVPRRAAGDEHAAGLVGEPGEAGGPPQRLVLRPDRTGPVDPAGGDRGRRPDHEVEQHARFGRCGRHERNRRRMIGRDRGRREHLGPDPERLLPSDPFGCDRAPGATFELLCWCHSVERLRAGDPVPRVRDDRSRQLLRVVVVRVHAVHHRIVRSRYPVRA